MDSQDIHEIIDRSKKAANSLRLLTHARSCRGGCGNVQCRNTYGLLRHTIICALPIITCCCPVKGCHTTKRLLAHVVECSRESRMSPHPKSCIICTMAAEPVPAAGSSSSAMGVDESESQTPPTHDQSSGSDEEGSGHEPLSYAQATTLPIKTHVPSFLSPASSSSSSSSSSSDPFVVPSMLPKRFRSPGLELDTQPGGVGSIISVSSAQGSPALTSPPLSPTREPDKIRCTGEINARQGIRTNAKDL